MPSLAQTLQHFLAAHTAQRLWVAFSGGLDSTVLLHLTAQVAGELAQPVHVIHVNHQLSPKADQWQEHCRHQADAYALPFIAETVAVEKSGGGVEMAAREARYRAFAQHLQPGDLLLMAHHQDDQAETLLLRLLRGAGVKGLAAMKPLRSFGEAQLGRPFLSCTRAQLADYANAAGLAWVDDESNKRDVFDRNFLRLKVMPQLAQRWPNFSARWQHTAEIMSEADSLLSEYAREDLRAAGQQHERLGESIQLEPLLKYSPARRRALFREWVDACGYPPPDHKQLAQTAQLFEAADDAQPLIAWGTCELRRFAERLYLLPQLPPVPSETSKPLVQVGEVELPDGSQLRVSSDKAGLRAGNYTIRWRHGGERCKPRGRPHSQKLKKLLQEYELEPWLRDRVPLIYSGEELAAVGDLWVCDSFYTAAGEAWRLQWCYERRNRRCSSTG